MEAVIIYLSKAAGISSLFYLLHFFLLRNDTSFKLNRFFLLFGILLSILLPFLTFTNVVLVDAPVQLHGTAAGGELPLSNPTTETDWWGLSFYLYFTGFLFFLLRMLFQLTSLVKFLRKGISFKEGSFRFLETKEQVQPFSFFRTIIYNQALHSAEELEMILLHEKAHGRQLHTFDVLLVNLFSALLWFNPLVWLYRKAVVQNLEYLADRSTVAAEVPVKAYQKVLVKVSVGDLEPALVNSFYQSLIKKRIIMLNKKSSEKAAFWKVTLILPFLILFTFLFNVETKAQVKAKKDVAAIAVPGGDHLIVAITPRSTEKELQNLSELAKEKGVELEFDNVRRNSAGLITNIEARFKKNDSGQSGSYSLNDEKGINPFTFFLDQNGKSGFRSNSVGTATTYTYTKVEPSRAFSFRSGADSLRAGAVTFYADTSRVPARADSRATRIVIQADSAKNEGRFFFLSGANSVYYDKPLIVIDGIEMSASYNVNDIDPENIDAIKVLKGENATGKYGQKAKGGVIEIDLKDGKE